MQYFTDITWIEKYCLYVSHKKRLYGHFILRKGIIHQNFLMAAGEASFHIILHPFCIRLAVNHGVRLTHS